ncbi:hypothetical protein BAG01nite_43240 [Brevibacillus agri]|uniref:Superoxide dismutase [Cu-Zn] n=1 Tax=Brevibacillus agri TaxID=51101 RepID=A0A3M8ARN1_9BACL|nr:MULTISPECIES: superoxide dismutase family protein [Brevibacillus]ELK42337.1 superoxide dismutase (Cu-Zn) [Brevibacillus agri BAB-2500]EJL45916.1 Cu/Zn superoxide dismutase [Brevibacillus sp. CF112]MBY0055061.1 superoxide dismutase family protein [Brevibacillus agri]MCG5252106.1 superoxide dismutase family protein [Brevibacillus agri]MDN4095205.1 superoxide dismutase family protein [Brevibacillus agri]
MNGYPPYFYDTRMISSHYAHTPTQAYAQIQGGPLAPNLNGYIVFTDVPYGTEVYVEVIGLPPYKPATGNQQPIGPFGFHLHEHGVCTVGNPDDPFTAAGSHWNPTNQPHGNHAGDFPVLFSNDGYARMSFFTNQFRAADVVGKSVIIHQSPDDYRTQPAGNSGKRLACGIIQPA